ncbi:MAG TPA: metallophosphoesterase [Ilumatobacteraceae bacterium]|nr:metallophosphoesterase [Ilumatobacteraceae bacterium]
MTNYDVIGDVHGHADALIGLLRTMGYAERDGAWRHPGRQAIFVGDLIDRGPQQLEVIHIVRRMVDAGSAQVVLGNHEFNAVAYATPIPGGGHLRPRITKNVEQHAAFIAAVGLDTSLHRELIDWFMTIPLWIELDGLRVIHACWSESDLAHLRDRVSASNCLTFDLLVDASDKEHQAYASIETLIKGPEVKIPGRMRFHDKGNHERHNVRLQWWDDSATNWRDLLPPGTPIFDSTDNPVEALPDEPIPSHLSKRYTDHIPVIFGHYWFEAPLEVMNPLALCVDYSAGAGGPLAAYRFEGEPTLSADNLVSF